MRGSAAAINTPNFAALVASVRRLALPLCAGVEPVQNRAWYVSQNVGSSGEMYACDTCFKEAIRDSGLGSCWHCKGAVREERVCEMYSARVQGQGRWRGWCARLRACATERMQVYVQTVPVIREMWYCEDAATAAEGAERVELVLFESEL